MASGDQTQRDGDRSGGYPERVDRIPVANENLGDQLEVEERQGPQAPGVPVTGDITAVVRGLQVQIASM